MRLILVDEVASTNEVVKAALREGKAEGLVVRARRQLGGYGRQGRFWDSPEGGLYLSVLLRPDVAGAGLSTLSLAVGLAVRQALASLAMPRFHDDIQLKWPNDVVFYPGNNIPANEYRKLCGISLEVCGQGVCVGIGVNVFRPEIDVPVQGRNVPEYLADLMPAPDTAAGERLTVTQAAGSLRDADLADFREQIIVNVQREVLAHLFVAYGRWRELGILPSLSAYERVSFLNGRPVAIEDVAGKVIVQGIVEGVDAQGRLLVRGESGVVPVASGEAHVIVRSEPVE